MSHKLAGLMAGADAARSLRDWRGSRFLPQLRTRILSRGLALPAWGRPNEQISMRRTYQINPGNI